MTTITVSEPPVEPVTLAEAIDWTRADDGTAATDAALTMLIKSMREYAENLTRRAFVQRRLALILPCWERCMRLQCPPLVSVESVKYYDSANVLQTLDPALYQVRTWKEPGEVAALYTAVWPATYARDDAVRVDYTAGYPLGTGSPTDYVSNLPAALKTWMHARIATLFDQRGTLMMNNMVAVPRDLFDGLLDGLIVGTRFG